MAKEAGSAVDGRNSAEEEFIARVWRHYEEHGRDDLPWRRTTDPYNVLVSEVMLQQTQVTRVVPKYEVFMREFPTVESLASASLGMLLGAWQGLGYNRRALALKRAAEIIVTEHGGEVPTTLDGLTALPGVGHATAAQVLAFAFDVGVPFIETNIRSVYLHEFFPDAEDVPDAAILPLVEATLDEGRPREWFWALLDYGAHLKATGGNPSRRSRHHTRQSRFEGSNRQLRGRILAALAGQEPLGDRLDTDSTAAIVGFDHERVVAALEALQSEGFVVSHGGRWRLG
ncbi:MAG TPA: A/G-specific adenine glycosylase [Actinobacteria bacterium]|nr:A/G-specific adenine glycosylase [Actinomycetota bacterium]